MALITIATAKGSPGATTTALALALHWPRPAILVEADLAGSSILSGFFRGQLPHDKGLAILAVLNSHDGFDAQFREQTIQLVQNDEEKRFMAGLPGPHAAPSMINLWTPLANYLASFERVGIDVIVDLGRVSAVRDERELFLRLSDQVLVVTGSRLPDVAVTRDLVRSYLGEVDPAARELTNFASLVIGPGRPYNEGEIARTLGLPSAGSIAWDPLSAEVLSVGAQPRKRYETSAFVQSHLQIIDRIQTRIVARRARLSSLEGA